MADRDDFDAGAAQHERAAMRRLDLAAHMERDGWTATGRDGDRVTMIRAGQTVEVHQPFGGAGRWTDPARPYVWRDILDYETRERGGSIADARGRVRDLLPAQDRYEAHRGRPALTEAQERAADLDARQRALKQAEQARRHRQEADRRQDVTRRPPVRVRANEGRAPDQRRQDPLARREAGNRLRDPEDRRRTREMWKEIQQVRRAQEDRANIPTARRTEWHTKERDGERDRQHDRQAIEAPAPVERPADDFDRWGQPGQAEQMDDSRARLDHDAAEHQRQQQQEQEQELEVQQER